MRGVNTLGESPCIYISPLLQPTGENVNFTLFVDPAAVRPPTHSPTTWYFDPRSTIVYTLIRRYIRCTLVYTISIQYRHLARTSFRVCVRHVICSTLGNRGISNGTVNRVYHTPRPRTSSVWKLRQLRLRCI